MQFNVIRRTLNGFKYYHLTVSLQKGSDPSNECPGKTLNNRMVRFQECGIFGEFGVLLHCLLMHLTKLRVVFFSATCLNTMWVFHERCTCLYIYDLTRGWFTAIGVSAGILDKQTIVSKSHSDWLPNTSDLVPQVS